MMSVNAVSDDEECSNRVPLRFGSVWVSPIIDSGAGPNVLAPDLWRKLKKAGIAYTEATVDFKVYPYGKKEPLNIQGAVIFCVQSRTRAINAKFLIAADDEGDYETVVGRRLSFRLGILRIGEEAARVNHLCIEAVGSSKTGKLANVLLSIPLDESVPPVAQPCRRVPFALRKKILEHTAELIEEDIIEEVKDEPTTWVSPIVPVIKKNGSLRLCIDMRQANKAVLREKFPIPTFEELLAEMTDCTTFSKIDLRSAYNQVELDPASRAITTFVTPDGVFRFKRLYCGIKCAPEMFQRIMTSVIAGLENVRVFFDDIIVFSKNRVDHERHVNALLQRLRNRGLTINLDKSTFGVDEVEFLGHRISKNKIKPNVTNEQAIRAFQPPTNKKDLQSFLGLMNYISRFIPDYSTLTAPLRQLLGKNVTFQWTQTHSDTFNKLKLAVLNVELAIYDPNATILIYSDASPVALGAVLMQRRSQESQPEILAFASRSLSKPEQNYSQIEREALGLIWACERFRLYTLGKNFELYTDHKPLEVLFGPKSKPNARIERWILRLQNFDYTIKYIRGEKNLADPFSRLAHRNPSRHSYAPNIRSTVRSLAVSSVPCAISLDEFRAESEKDAEISAVIKALRENLVPPEAFLKVRFELTFVDTLLLRGDRLVPPASLRHRILSQAHEGHPGIEIMKRRLRTKVWWPKIDAEAAKFVKNCHSCLVVSQVDPPEPMQRSTLPTRPWEYVAIDHLGPLPNGQYLLLVVDYFSRFVEFQFVPATSSAVTIASLYQTFARFGFPNRLKSDNATVFSSAEFRDFLAEYGVTHVTSPPLWPRANGEVERQNRSILKRLKIAALEKRCLRVELAKYILLYHGTPHSSTGATPAELMLQRKIRDKLPSLSNPSPLYDAVRDTDAENKIGGKTFAEKRRGLTGPKRQLTIGDQVLVQAKKTNKLSPTFDPNPFTVTESKPGEVTVRRGTQVFRRSSSAVKLVPRQSMAGEGPDVSDTPAAQSPSLSVTPPSSDAAPVSPVGSPFKGFPDTEDSLVQSRPDAAYDQQVTRSGRVVHPPRRLDL